MTAEAIDQIEALKITGCLHTKTWARLYAWIQLVLGTLLGLLGLVLSYHIATSAQIPSGINKDTAAEIMGLVFFVGIIAAVVGYFGLRGLNAGKSHHLRPMIVYQCCSMVMSLLTATRKAQSREWEEIVATIVGLTIGAFFCYVLHKAHKLVKLEETLGSNNAQTTKVYPVNMC